MGTGEQVKDIADKLKDLKLGESYPSFWKSKVLQFSAKIFANYVFLTK